MVTAPNVRSLACNDFRKVPYRIDFPEELIGGGKIYCEIVKKGEEPQFKSPYGVFVSALGIPKVTKILWTDYDNNPIGNQLIAVNSHILLHIYTEGLYGQELRVRLYDHDTITADDELEDSEVVTLEDDSTETKSFYDIITEVNLYREGGGVMLRFSKDKLVSYVQKAIVKIQVPLNWKSALGPFSSELEVYPKISFNSKFLYKNVEPYVRVSFKQGDEKKKQEYNTPILIDYVDTIFNSASPCYFTNIKADVVTKKYESKEIVVFDANLVENKTTLNVVAGSRENFADISMTLDTNTDHCFLEENGHQGQVIKFDEEFAKGYNRTQTKESMELESQLPSGLELENTIKLGDFEISTINKYFGSGSQFNYYLSSTDDTQIDMRFLYRYQITGIEDLWELIKCKRPNQYRINLNTCRLSKPLFVNVYPDVRFILQLALSFDSDEFNEMRNKHLDTRKANLESIQSLSEKIRELEDKKNRRTNYSRRERKPGGKQEENERRNERLDAQINELESQKGTIQDTVNQGSASGMKEAWNKSKIGFNWGIFIQHDASSETEYNYTLNLKDAIKGVVDKVEGVIENIIGIYDFVEGFLGAGSNDDNSDNDRSELQMLMNSAVRKPYKYEVLLPEIALSVAWFAERPNDVTTTDMGTTYSLLLQAKPIIGFKVSFDLLELGARSNPISYTIVRLIRLAEQVVEGVEVDLSFVVEGGIYAAAECSYNTLEESSYVKRATLAEEKREKEKLEQEMSGDNTPTDVNTDEDTARIGNNVPFDVTGKIDMTLQLSIKASADFSNVLFSKITPYDALYAEAEVKLKSGFGINAKLVCKPDVGLNWDLFLTFAGLKIEGVVRCGAINTTESNGRKKFKDQDGTHFEKKVDWTIFEPDSYQIS